MKTNAMLFGVVVTGLALAAHAGDVEARDVTVIDVLAHTYKTAQLAKVKCGDAYKPFAAARYSNNFPFRLTNDVGKKSKP